MTTVTVSSKGQVVVLRAFYRFRPEAFARVVDHLIGLPNVTVEDWSAVAEAVEWHRDGLDFADALHLTRSSHCDRLVTFDDRRFARRARRLGTQPPVVLPSGP